MNPGFMFTAPLLAGYALDLLLGDPFWLPHPSGVIGWFINMLEPVLRWAFPRNETGERRAGILLATLVPLISLLVPAVFLAILSTVHPVAWMIAETVICYQLIGTRTLRDTSARVYRLMKERDQHGDLSRARLALSRIAGIDTWTLNSREIIRITVLATGRGIVDKIVAPMLFLAVGGGALGMLFASVEALDTAVGRKSGKLSPYGEASAKLYDFLRLAPSALASVLTRAASLITGFDYHGLLGGDYGARDALVDDIKLENRMLLMSSLLCVTLFVALKLAFLSIIF